jgi:hypothetical protein
VPAALAATMSAPGAAISGLTAKSPRRGPALKKPAVVWLRLVAATDKASVAVAGLFTEYLPHVARGHHEEGAGRTAEFVQREIHRTGAVAPWSIARDPP